MTKKLTHTGNPQYGENLTLGLEEDDLTVVESQSETDDTLEQFDNVDDDELDGEYGDWEDPDDWMDPAEWYKQYLAEQNNEQSEGEESEDDEDDDEDDYDDEDDGYEEEEDDEEEEESPSDSDLIKQLRNEAARRRVENRELRKQLEAATNDTAQEKLEEIMGTIADTFNLNPTEDLTPEQVVQTIREHTTDERGEQAIRDLAIYKAATPLGIDYAKLLDSKSFEKTIADLDPYSETFESDVAAAVAHAAETHPSLKEQPRLSRAGGDFSGGQKADSPENKTIAELRQERRKRRMKH